MQSRKSAPDYRTQRSDVRGLREVLTNAALNASESKTTGTAVGADLVSTHPVLAWVAGTLVNTCRKHSAWSQRLHRVDNPHFRMGHSSFNTCGTCIDLSRLPRPDTVYSGIRTLLARSSVPAGHTVIATVITSRHSSRTL